MDHTRLPIFIATPFIGQGDIHNEEWIDGRIALFEAVTKNSLLNLLDRDVHWLIFLGREPIQKVVDYAESIFTGRENVHLLQVRHSSENVTNMAIQLSKVNNYATVIIADDDAWPKDYITTIRTKAKVLIEKGDEHAGLTFANGLEWVMADQVDIHFLQKSGFKLLRKQNLVEYRYPWLGCGFFILQTKQRPFNSLTVAHPMIPSKLKEEGFSIHVSEDPKRAWLYNRHQLSASSLVKSENEPLRFSLLELEEEFGIDAAKVSQWTSSRFSSYYSEKAQGVGMLDMYEFPDLEDFVHMPFKSFFLNNGYLSIKPSEHFNIHGQCRLRIYNSTSKKYEILFNFHTKNKEKIRFHESMFNSEHEYKFDVQIMIDGAWNRIMPYVFIKFKELDHPVYVEEKDDSTLKVQLQQYGNSMCKISLRLKEALLRYEAPANRILRCIFDASLVPLNDEYSISIHIMENEEWQIQN